jgi:hypothetical protein
MSILDWTPAKEPRAEETAIDENSPFGGRAVQILRRDLTGTGYVPTGTSACHQDGDLTIFRCEIVKLEDATTAIWIFVENQQSGIFSTHFLF